VVASTYHCRADVYVSAPAEWDRAHEERARIRNNLEEYCNLFEDAIKELGKGVDECRQWLDDTSSRPLSDTEIYRQEEVLLTLTKRVLPPGYKVVRESSESTTPGAR
jgi:hypothetical protein